MKKIALLAALALSASPALAQDGALSADDARAFLEPLSEQAQEAVANGNWQGIQSWMAEHVADEAPIYMSGEFVSSKGPSMTFTGSMKGEDLQAFASRGMGGPQNGGMNTVEDYTLELRIMDIWELADGQVAAAVAFYEHGLIPEGADAPMTGAFSSATECALRMSGGGDDVKIELANCTIDANL